MALLALASALKEEGRPPDPAPSDPVGAVSEEVLRKQLMEFDAAPDDAAKSEKFDDVVEHTKLVAYVRARYKPLSPGATYNLACYYARIRAWDRARAELRRAVELGGPRAGRLALRDFSLEEYREDDSRLAELDRLVRAGLDPKPSPGDSAPTTPTGRILEALTK